MAVFHARNCRLYIGAVEAPYVRSVVVSAPVDDLVVTTVEFIGAVSYKDGIFRLAAGKPTLGPVTVQDETGTPFRAISLTGVPAPD